MPLAAVAGGRRPAELAGGGLVPLAAVVAGVGHALLPREGVESCVSS